MPTLTDESNFVNQVTNIEWKTNHQQKLQRPAFAFGQAVVYPHVRFHEKTRKKSNQPFPQTIHEFLLIKITDW